MDVTLSGIVKVDTGIPQSDSLLIVLKVFGKVREVIEAPISALEPMPVTV